MEYQHIFIRQFMTRKQNMPLIRSIQVILSVLWPANLRESYATLHYDCDMLFISFSVTFDYENDGLVIFYIFNA